MSNIKHVKYLPDNPDYLDFAIRILRTILLEYDKQNRQMKTDSLISKFFDFTNVDFKIFLKDRKQNFEDFLIEEYSNEFEVKNGFVSYKNVYEEISRLEMIKIPKYLGKNKYVTRPIENSSLHSISNSLNKNKNLNSSVASKNTNHLNSKINFSVDNEIRLYNVCNNMIGNMDDTMNSVNEKMLNCDIDDLSENSINIKSVNIMKNDSFDVLMNLEDNEEKRRVLCTISLLDDD